LSDALELDFLLLTALSAKKSKAAAVAALAGLASSDELLFDFA